MATRYVGDDEFGPVYEDDTCTMCEGASSYLCDCRDRFGPNPNCDECGGTGIAACPCGGNA